jgi:hypothetical protein
VKSLINIYYIGILHVFEIFFSLPDAKERDYIYMCEHWLTISACFKSINDLLFLLQKNLRQSSQLKDKCYVKYVVILPMGFILVSTPVKVVR